MTDLKELCSRVIQAIASVRTMRGWHAANRIAIRWSLWASKRRRRTEASRHPRDVAWVLMGEANNLDRIQAERMSPPEPERDSMHPEGI